MASGRPFARSTLMLSLLALLLACCGQSTSEGDQGRPCSSKTDCDSDTGCLQWVCVENACTPVNIAKGTAAPDAEQSQGDCARLVCNGAGEAVSQHDESDQPASNADDPCTVQYCDQGLKSRPSNLGVTCSGGVCQADGSCGYQLYQRPLNSLAWQAKPLSEAYVGPNAPPTQGILGAVYLTRYGLLFIFADDGKTYRRQGGSWLTPAATSTLFPALDSKAVACLYQINDTNQDFVSLFSLVTSKPRSVYFYRVDSAGNIIARPGNSVLELEDPGQPAPPLASLDCMWSFEEHRAPVGSPEWYVIHSQFGDKVYFYDGESARWEENWSVANSLPWRNTTSAPPVDGVVAAYNTGSTLYMIAP